MNHSISRLIGALLLKTRLCYWPVSVRTGVAAGARWTLYPWSAYWRGGFEPELQNELIALGDITGWTHGMWKGRDWVDGVDVDMTAPDVAGMTPFGLLDHVGKARIGDAEGWGLFEHATFGAHSPSGFTDFGSVAP